MSDPVIDELAESARNRGLKLVRSRVRTPGKRRFGKVGLTDAKGKPVFGMDAKGPTAKPEDAEEYLRNLGAKDWGASLDVAVLPKKRRPTRVARPAANDTEPEQQPTRVAPSPPPSIAAWATSAPASGSRRSPSPSFAARSWPRRPTISPPAARIRGRGGRRAAPRSRLPLPAPRAPGSSRRASPSP